MWRWEERCRDRDTVWCREAVVAEQVVPHSCVVDKYWDRHLGSEQSQSQDRPHSLGF